MLSVEFFNEKIDQGIYWQITRYIGLNYILDKSAKRTNQKTDLLLKTKQATEK